MTAPEFPAEQPPQDAEQHCECEIGTDGICGARCGAGKRCGFCLAWCASEPPVEQPLGEKNGSVRMNLPPEPPTRHSAADQVQALPQTVFVGANRYDTDNEHVLHLWTADGQSFDVRFRKREGSLRLKDPSQDALRRLGSSS